MARNQFRIVVGSYEHNILCLSLDLTLETPVFTPIFHFQAHSLSVKCLDISKRYLVSGSNDEHIRIYDLQKRKELGTLLAHQGSITALKFSRGENNSSNKWLLSASDDNKIIIWRVKDWENFGTLKGHIARINDLAIHPSNRIAVSVSDDHSIRLWNLMTVKKAAVLKLRNYNQNGQFVRWLGTEGQHFAVGLMTKVLIYSTDDAKVHHELDLKRKTLMHMETVQLGDIEYLCIGLNDGNIEFYETKKLLAETELVSTLTPEFSLLGHTNRVKDFNFYKNEHGTYLVSIGSDGKVVVWNITSEKQEQLAVYDCGERLNCLALCDEAIEKYDTMRKRDSDKADLDDVQSEVESDTEEIKKAMFGKKQKRSKKQKKAKKISVELE
ncbi:similar to Saccharomyces cerevisiae YKL021C MAK11 Protein involved in an early, nucleolar step of 60S ribosomal subunit biogenesis [Maudiozyma saulgeensis]|uniref:Similar to Saccharomyces cerevisiae YKL021C MAK11 Protein involved in an early, nucleolar step of 60S ribosomal subunit biogenesis n=1 Tax=Maudiozyma saulgeensis TaxID=1789683 RepID=A0A1X7QWB1_9SACH|nr:similar to Saccharomyces cerevisiae YKL021C MAK11 Protein involved in an early, nucleolar step of 60S ribosomal subunit biogenesis [Kazachstania saulgeensis]